MTKIGEPIPDDVKAIRDDLESILDELNFQHIDASHYVTGRDFLLKIWQLIVSVPIGIAIIGDSLTAQTMANVFYEIGLMHAIGKETIVLKTQHARVPSDFVRTEYVTHDGGFENRIRSYFDTIQELAEHYFTVAKQLEANPALSIDYMKRSYLITGDESIKDAARSVYQGNDHKKQFGVLNLESLMDFGWFR